MDGIIYPLSRREKWIVACCMGFAWGCSGVILTAGVILCIAYA